MRKNKFKTKKVVQLKQNKMILFLIIFLLIIFFLCVGLFFIINQKKILEEEFFEYKNNSFEKINYLENNVIELEKENNSLQLSLSQLELEYFNLSESNKKLGEEYSFLKEEVDLTIQKIVDYEKEIQESMDWFRTNSFLGEKQKNILLQLKSNCINETIDSCQINLACLSLINNEFQNFSYLVDTKTSQEIDKMQSIEQFISNKGGDCEDYSLLFKAEYNSLVKDCLEEKKEIKLFTWAKGNTRYWLNNSSTWYRENAKKIFLEKDYIYPIIVCGNMYDFQSQKVNGHCMIAFTKKEIFSTQDLIELNNAPIVEPQNGLYIGKINSDSNINMIDFEKNYSYINTLITNQDFFLYSKNNWNNYSEFKEQLSQKKELLKKMLIE
ncbi:MAG: hypothetical protein PHP82_04200 [Candidatus ainarchaeum sp.]|nr:hypothetical protein [Candidatus ainarchaeum sp.]